MALLTTTPTHDGRYLLNLGCGTHFHPQWTNVDLASTAPEVQAYNILKGVPFQPNTFDAVYHSHVLEHLEYSAAEEMIRECYRVLKSGGIIRVVIPDLAYLCRRYLQALDELYANPENPVLVEHHQWSLISLLDQMVRTRSGGEVVRFLSQPHLVDKQYISESTNLISELENQIYSKRSLGSRLRRLTPRKISRLLRKRLLETVLGSAYREVQFRQLGEVHKWMYDDMALRQMLLKTGFVNVQLMTASTSSIQQWNDYRLDQTPDGAPRKPNSLFMEASKPQR